ncbi:MAG: glycosyltransferase [Nitrospirae bacterium]|nr:glycosyltransferase [Nitrospirota bacterium]
MTENKHLSIIVASYRSERTIEACLMSLERQQVEFDYEIIVVHSSDDSTPELIKEKFPQVILFSFKERKSIGEARNFAITKACGEIIAIIDADCTVDSTWAANVVKAHELKYLAIGGAVANGNPYSYVGWGQYFCEFSAWMPCKDSKMMSNIPAASISYKHEVFKKCGLFVEDTYCEDTEFHWRLSSSGHYLFFTPLIVVYHHNRENLADFLKHMFMLGMAFARFRLTKWRYPLITRSVYSAFSPLIPVRLLLRIVFINCTNRIYFPHFVKALPLLFLGLISWSLGELISYITGSRH